LYELINTVAIGKARAACAQSFALWQQATIELTCHDHSIVACSCHVDSVFLRSHPIRGESHSQHNATGEVATASLLFYNEPHGSHVLCVNAELSTTSTSWSHHHFVAIRKPEQHLRKASHCDSKQQ